MPDKARPLTIVVAAALVRPDGKVLLQRRPPDGPLPDLWEFPGGKVEPGETAEAALSRELAEELGVAVEAAAMTPLALATAPLQKDPLLLLLYIVHAWAGEPEARHAAELRWLMPAEMAALPMPAPDVPLVAALARALG